MASATSFSYQTRENGPASPGAASHDREQFYRCNREVLEEAIALGAAIDRAIGEWEIFLRDNLQARPYITLGAVAGLGYVLGGGLPRNVARQLIGIAARAVALAWAREYVAKTTGTTARERAHDQKPEGSNG